ncbi:methylated-DNA--[protein]-cysteine S-methyltransferase [Clostridium sp. C105KSO13]|uniref:methylated-DNA--[protein]-cysteine S-methyltransferase n=1 Tax=Clostridium sp. C105KSO13 TaxID=1776045 RepID=UPI0007407D34|nr:methylated-DNA--[protein]-cysteine S-methyltransferase [Clostridium sp. C105KSO13]CUX28586.1 Methylated-DNA--protein-cysteine methyltransferase [Clostridium sp. C105KSO13]
MEQNTKGFIYYYPSDIGRITLASDGKNITGLWIQGQKYYGSTMEKSSTEENIGEEMRPVFKQAKLWLDTYFSGKEPEFPLPLAPKGSPFRHKVWKILCDIPYGQVVTYGDIAKALAKELGKKNMSAQAVGGAVGHNPISIMIPCHRVVGADGSLTGYAGGVHTKVKLLELERADMEGLYIPKKGTAL